MSPRTISPAPRSPQNTHHIVIVGATSTIAEHCARHWVHQPHTTLTLVARDAIRADVIAADLRIRNPHATVHTLITPFTDPAAITAAAQNILAIGVPTLVLIAHGALPNQVAAQQDISEVHAALTLNGLSPALWAEAFAAPMQAAAGGTIALISSVAGDRGRKSNYIYGAAKGLVTRYAEGLQHRFADTNVNVCLIKPGPTDTPMTAHLKPTGARLASPETVSASIVRGIAQRRRVIYTPRKWQLIMFVISHLPFVLFRKLNI